MAAHGIKFDNRKLQKFIDNRLEKQIRIATKAGVKALEDISMSAIQRFYSVNNKHIYTSIPNSVQIKEEKYRQNKDYIWCDITMYIDESVYLSQTEKAYRIYRWADNEDRMYPHENVGRFVIGLQWRHGIIGLPDPYFHYYNTPMRQIVTAYIKKVWTKKLKYLLPT